jgi:hypothetical protein
MTPLTSPPAATTTTSTAPRATARDGGPAPGAEPPARPRPVVERPAVPPVLSAASLPPEVLRARLRSGELVRVLRGWYAPRPPDGPPWETERHLFLARVAAAHRTRTGEHWFSHGTAALLHGCALVRLPRAVDVTARVVPHVRRTVPGVRPRWTASPVRLAQVERVGGLAVSTLECAVVDGVAELPREQGIVLLDSALRVGADPAVIDEIVSASPGVRGIRRVRELLELGDGRAESVGEPLLRYAVLGAGLPAPDLQVPVRTRDGWRWVDLGWRSHRLAVEFDGAGKYGATAVGAASAVLAERRRQDVIEEAGWRVLRVDWRDLSAPAATTARIGAALRVAPRRDRSAAPTQGLGRS